MVTLLAKIFIQEKNDQAKIREEYGVLCGVVGILFNVLLFAGKFLAGTISHSIAITADAVNNLSDAGSSIVTLAGFKLAGTKPDTEHPFGHGRIEYISGLVVAAAILLMAYELIRDSVGKIVHPEETEFSGLIVVILVLSILVKLYMYFYNHRIGKKLDSAAMQATAIDSCAYRNRIPAIQPIINKQLTLLTTSYGMRINPFQKGLRSHQGVDYAIPEGSRVFCCGAWRTAPTMT